MKNIRNEEEAEKKDLGKHLPSGANHYRAYIGSPEIYDLLASSHFLLLIRFGLREHHTLLDIGCGSLRMGKLLLIYLLLGRYYAIEPNQWLVNEGIEKECGRDLISLKRPTFAYVDDFSCSRFGRRFDFIFAHSIFTHASLSQIRTCISEAKKSMKNETIFLATYTKGEKDYTGEEWVYPGQSKYRPETMINLIQDYGLCMQEVPFETLINQTWIAITLPEHEKDVAMIISNMGGKGNPLSNQIWKDKYEQLMQHPWVRIGRKMNYLFHISKFFKNRRD